MGFNNKIIYINSLNTPAVSFDIHTNEIENSVEIIDYEISGNYTNSYWEFGDGISSEEYWPATHFYSCLLYTSDAADERSSVDLGGRRIIKKKNIDIGV